MGMWHMSYWFFLLRQKTLMYELFFWISQHSGLIVELPLCNNKWVWITDYCSLKGSHHRVYPIKRILLVPFVSGCFSCQSCLPSLCSQSTDRHSASLIPVAFLRPPSRSFPSLAAAGVHAARPGFHGPSSEGESKLTFLFICVSFSI